jgi:hypothetical protein
MDDHFGVNLRTAMISASPAGLNAGVKTVIGGFASLFNELALPVAMALLNLRPRRALFPTYVCETQEELLTRASDYVKAALQKLYIKVLPPDLHTEL